MICLVDDAHWLDPATADALLFSARRLGAGAAPAPGVTRTPHRRDRRQSACPPRAPDPAQRRRVQQVPRTASQLHLSTRVEQAFLDRSRELPRPVQTLLLLAAADDTGGLTLVRASAVTLGIEEHAVEGAVASGLLVAHAGAVQVRHPLVRSAIYQAASEVQFDELISGTVTCRQGSSMRGQVDGEVGP